MFENNIFNGQAAIVNFTVNLRPVKLHSIYNKKNGFLGFNIGCVKL